MNTTWVALALGVVLAFSAGTASADRNQTFFDTAKVLDAEPIYKNVRLSHPVRECWNEQVIHHNPRHRSYSGAVMGGIIGGVIGNQIGRGRGKGAMTVAGTLLGASIGNDISHRNHHDHGYATTERRCEVTEHYTYEEQLVGYRVKYRYKGNIFTTRTKSDPGRRIRVSVNVRPVEE